MTTVYKVITSSEQVMTLLCPYHNVLPEAVCNFVATFMLMNNVWVQSFNFIRASICQL